MALNPLPFLFVMKLGNVLRNVVKASATMFVVGLALGAAAPLLAGMLGEAAIGSAAYAAANATSALWTGAFFGAFGALNAAISPALEWAFGSEQEKATQPGHKQGHGKGRDGHARLVIVAPHHEKNDIDINVLAVDDSKTRFVANLQEERARPSLPATGKQL